MGLEREGENREDRGETSMMATGGGDEDVMVYERGTAERKIERESRKEGMELREEIGGRKKKGLATECWK